MAETYRVLYQEQYDNIAPGGRFVASRRVVAETIPDGDQFEISIPVSEFNPDVVAATLAQHAADLIAVRRL